MPDEKPKIKTCKDCVREYAARALSAGSNADVMPVRGARPAPHPGPRCTTHHRAEKKRRSAERHEADASAKYGLKRGEYERILKYQGGKCFICQVANGAVKRLAIDHDHTTGFVRGILCGPCNQLIGRARNGQEFFRRAISYLEYPPAMMMGLRRAPRNEESDDDDG